ncbi:hypothetical protein CPC08DRAFT_820596 [Agrocybe pediades]|nr:hypothetical protein CPC08DRAFT_820596 [Agrocybe pediades]
MEAKNCTAAKCAQREESFLTCTSGDAMNKLKRIKLPFPAFKQKSTHRSRGFLSSMPSLISLHPFTANRDQPPFSPHHALLFQGTSDVPGERSGSPLTNLDWNLDDLDDSEPMPVQLSFEKQLTQDIAQRTLDSLNGDISDDDDEDVNLYDVDSSSDEEVCGDGRLHDLYGYRRHENSKSHKLNLSNLTSATPEFANLDALEAADRPNDITDELLMSDALRYLADSFIRNPHQQSGQFCFQFWPVSTRFPVAARWPEPKRLSRWSNPRKPNRRVTDAEEHPYPLDHPSLPLNYDFDSHPRTRSPLIGIDYNLWSINEDTNTEKSYEDKYTEDLACIARDLLNIGITVTEDPNPFGIDAAGEEDEGGHLIGKIRENYDLKVR